MAHIEPPMLEDGPDLAASGLGYGESVFGRRLCDGFRMLTDDEELPYAEAIYLDGQGLTPAGW